MVLLTTGAEGGLGMICVCVKRRRGNSHDQLEKGQHIMGNLIITSNNYIAVGSKGIKQHVMRPPGSSNKPSLALDMDETKIRDVLKFISDELRELDLGTTSIPRITTPSSIEFLRDYVSPNKPVIITNSTAHWPALSLWSNPTHLLSVAGSQPVTVAFTPNGRADAIVSHPNDPTKQYFALPHQQQMPLSSFLNIISNTTSSSLVPYLQQQNSSLTQELPQLLPDVASHLPWATEAFGGVPPDAVNIWIGDHRSVTSFHKDNYENLYAVITGSKTFYLYPPVDVYKMNLRQVEVAQWCPVVDNNNNNNNSSSSSSSSSSSNGGSNSSNNGGEMEKGMMMMMELKLVPDVSGRKVLWSSLEVPPPPPPPPPREDDSNSNDNNDNDDGCFIVTVKAGEVLYLPSMWWHAVAHDHGKSSSSEEEEGPVIAVNYWYDMRYDVKYAYSEGISRLAEMAGLSECHPDEKEERKNE